MDENQHKTMKQDVEEIILIKDGKEYKVTAKFDIPEEEYKSKIITRHRSQVELKLIMLTLGVSEEEAKKMTNEEAFRALNDGGYSIIKNYRGCKSPETNELFIASNITKEDATLIIKNEDQFLAENENRRVEIHNRVNYEKADEYDYVDSLQSVRCKEEKKEKILEIINTFLNEKNNQLNKYQKEMLDHYRRFDLERMLTTDERQKYALNDGNAGVIVITPDTTYASTCRKEQHGAQVTSIMQNYYYNDFQKNRNFTFMPSSAEPEGPEVFHSIMIQVSYDENYPLIMWKPEKINEFQYQQLIKLTKEIKKIEQKTGKTITYAYRDKINGNIDKELVSNDDFQIELERDHDALTDDTIKLEKSTPPRSATINLGDVLDIFSVKDVSESVEKNEHTRINQEEFARKYKEYIEMIAKEEEKKRPKIPDFFRKMIDFCRGKNR